MRLHIACSGGFGGLRIEGELDKAELEEGLRTKLEAALAGGALERAAAGPIDPRTTDAQNTELTVLPGNEDDTAQRYRLDDSRLDAELLELVDGLRRALVQKKARAAGK